MLCLTLALLAPAAAQEPERLDAVVQPLVDAEILVGAVVGILRDGETLVRGYGRVTMDEDTAPDGDTVYEIGSITKVFTGVLLADASLRGLVALDDPVREHVGEGFSIPAFENQPIRLFHLSTHTSALPRMPSNFRPANPLNPYADYGVERMAEFLAGHELRGAPGVKSAYSNLGAGLLGHVLTVVHEKSYEALLVERIAGPLEMAHTRIAFTDSMRERLAPPYSPDLRPAANWDLTALAGAGAIRSTVNDLLLFARANLAPDETPLAAALKLAQKEHFEIDDEGNGVGLGWFRSRGGKLLTHSGGTGGYRTSIGVHPESGRAYVVLTNTATSKVDQLSGRIADLVLSGAAEAVPVRSVVAVDRAILARYVGKYTLAPVTFSITLEADGLHAQLTGQDAHRIYPESETRFFYRVVEAAISFEVTDEGEVTALTLHQGGRDQRAEKTK